MWGPFQIYHMANQPGHHKAVQGHDCREATKPGMGVYLFQRTDVQKHTQAQYIIMPVVYFDLLKDSRTAEFENFIQRDINQI